MIAGWNLGLYTAKLMVARDGVEPPPSAFQTGINEYLQRLNRS